jgi:predicted TIM-barrel fold metal-dependent hydrolase
MATKYQSNIDLEKIEAIDSHVHIEVSEHGHCSLPAELAEAASKYFKAGDTGYKLDQVANYYRKLNIAAIVFTIDATTSLGHSASYSDEIAIGASANSDVLIPFGSVDPLQGQRAIDRAEELVNDFGVRGFKFHPTLQNFNPAHDEFGELFSKIQALDVPIIVHTGQTGIGAGLPGGAGLKLGLSNPMLLDEVAANFPELQIVMAHPSAPWQEEAISVATHKLNTWIDLSGWAPKYFPQNLVRQANSLLQNKVLFGTDFPLLTPERWLSEFEALELKDEVRPKVLKDNAVRLLKLR